MTQVGSDGMYCSTRSAVPSSRRDGSLGSDRFRDRQVSDRSLLVTAPRQRANHPGALVRVGGREWIRRTVATPLSAAQGVHGVLKTPA
jgi:hypothetical protein